MFAMQIEKRKLFDPSLSLLFQNLFSSRLALMGTQTTLPLHGLLFTHPVYTLWVPLMDPSALALFHGT